MQNLNYALVIRLLLWSHIGKECTKEDIYVFWGDESGLNSKKEIKTESLLWLMANYSVFQNDCI